MYKKMMKGWMKHLDFMIWDIAGLELAFAISYLLRHGMPDRMNLLDPYRDMALIIVALSICATFFLSSYQEIIRRGYLMEIKQVFFHCMFVSVGLIVWMFVIKESDAFSRTVVLLMFPVSVILVCLTRLLWKRNVRRRIQERKEFRKMLVLAKRERLETVIKGLDQPYRSYRLDGCIVYEDSEPVGTEIAYVPVVTKYGELLSYVQEHVVDEIFIDLPGKDEETERLSNILISMGLVVHINLVQFGFSLHNRIIHNFADFTVLSSGMKIATARQLFFKRLLDICGGITGLIIAAVIYCIFGPVIKKQSPGPILFSQERVGKNGRRFKIYKFRTMYPDAEERKKELMAQNKMNGLMFKMDNDPRIIPIGHFMRKTSLDEFPQFWNVLKGDMSLVGTRPPTVDEYEQYEITHRKRLAMKPGLTGMWQVSGRSDIVDFEEVVALDAKYITEWTLSMDVKILWKTIVGVVKQKGAV